MQGVSIVKVVAHRFDWTDELLNGGRRARLWLVSKGGHVFVFAGASIPGTCNVLREERGSKAGKWTKTYYTVEVGSAVPVVLCAPLHGSVWSTETNMEEAYTSFMAIAPAHTTRAGFEEAMRASFARKVEEWEAAASSPPLE